MPVTRSTKGKSRVPASEATTSGIEHTVPTVMDTTTTSMATEMGPLRGEQPADRSSRDQPAAIGPASPDEPSDRAPPPRLSSPRPLARPPAHEEEHRSPTGSRTTSTASQRRRRLLRAKAEYLQIQAELAAVKMASLEAESHSEDDIDTVVDETGQCERVDHWLDNSRSHMVVTTEDRRKPPPLPPAPPPPPTAPTATVNIEDGRIPTPAPPKPAGVNIGATTELAQLAAAISEVARSSQPPPRTHIELPVFTGAHQEWLSFKAAYRESRGGHTTYENLTRLRRSLKGRAKEAVESLLIYSSNPDEVMKTLESRFGRPDCIAMAELERLRGLPRLSDAPRDVCIFASRVANTVATLEAIEKRQYLYNPEVTKVTIDKLTSTMKYRWYDYAADQDENEPDLIKLARFLNREADRCGPYAQPEPHREPHREPIVAPPRRQQRAYTTHTTPPKRTPEPTAQVCLACNESGHALRDCNQFRKLGVNGRWDMAKEKRLCFRCLRHRNKDHHCKPVKCNTDGCPHFHHTLLHHHKREKKEVVSSTWTPARAHAYLKIIPIQIVGNKRKIETFALLDDGSTVTLIDEQLAQQAGLKGPVEPFRIEAMGNQKVDTGASRRVKMTIRGTAGGRHHIQARTIQQLRLSAQTVSSTDLGGCKHLEDIAHRLTYEKAKPQVLIGQDNWPLLMAEDKRVGSKRQPVASLTRLGWVLHGAHCRAMGQRVHFVHQVAGDINEDLKQFFSLESFGVAPKRPQSDPEARAMKMLEEKTVRLEDGRFQTGLLWKSEDIKLPNNREYAMKRLHSTEKKIDKNHALKSKVNEQMEALITKGYAEVAPIEKPEHRTWYLPCFPVVNPMKPEKVRMVHDAAANTRGVSLNDTLLTGPDLLQSLPGVLMRMRQHKIAVSADIAEMFLQVKIRPEDRDALRYLWRGEERDAPPTEYRMTSLIFGATSSPATAIFIKNKNAREAANEYPEAAAAIERNHYMDDYIQSFENEEKAVEIAQQVKIIHEKAHFHLHKWTSNSMAVLQRLDPDATQRSMHLSDGVKSERVLGLIWDTCNDNLGFNLNLSRLPANILNSNPTKRQALKVVMSLFDPLGLVSPVTITAKQILQEIWRRSTSWDEELDEDLKTAWAHWVEHLQQLKNIAIPRSYPRYTDASDLQLHVFVDASEVAYAAALYWRITTANGETHTSLVLAKARVTPLKMTSIPRLELQAAVMGSRMAQAVTAEHDLQPVSRTFWTDSKTVLTWLRTGARAFKPFVAHRIAELEDTTKTEEWRWVPTKLNVADDATRGVPRDFNGTHRWFTGPPFLQHNMDAWPVEKREKMVPSTGEERTLHVGTSPTVGRAMPDPYKFSRWERLVRTTARVLQFIHLLRRPKKQILFAKNKPNKQDDPSWGRQYATRRANVHKEDVHKEDKYMKIETSMLVEAEHIIIRASQQDSFPQDIEDVLRGRQVSRQSKLKNLALEMNKGLLCIKSRIEAIDGISEDNKRPAILDGRHHTTRLYIAHIHTRGHHQGVEATVNQCRQRFHILHLRPTTKKIVRECVQCRRRHTKPSEPPTGDHPPSRLAHHQRPFSYTGVDYFGPLYVTVGRATHKRYVALFTCLTTRAVHLELATSLTTDSAVMALRRFIARRGCPREINSDNGTNLHGAERELRRAIDSATEIEASKRRIVWRFIPPSAPFMGGAWERLVRTVKTALAAVMNGQVTNDEVLVTILSEVEFTVNSRPLTHVPVDPNDPETLTPNHFILLGAAHEPAMGPTEERDLLNKKHWRASQRIADMFWSRWVREYLPELQCRREPHGKGPALKIDDMVIVVDSTLPRNTWPLGRVVAVYPGLDGVVRAADVLTKAGVLRRPTKKLVNLQIEEIAAVPPTE